MPNDTTHLTPEQREYVLRMGKYNGHVIIFSIVVLLFGVYGICAHGFALIECHNTYIPILVAIIIYSVYSPILTGVFASPHKILYPLSGFIAYICCLYTMLYLGVGGFVSMGIGEEPEFSILTTLRSIFYFLFGKYAMSLLAEMTNIVNNKCNIK